jgi:outer membrane protein
VLGALWDMALPVGPTRDFTSSFSGRGFALDFQYWGLGRLGLGAEFIWNTMSDKGMSERTINDVTVSGVAVKELDTNELLAKVMVSPIDWREARVAGHKKPFSSVVPYLGVALGGARVVRRVDISVSRYVDESWHWAFVPEVGVQVPASFATLMAAVRFNYIAGSSDAPEQMFMNFAVGGGF